jgi:transcriptional regulator with XRE-family HTH domain
MNRIRLQEIREQKGLTINELARRADVSAASISIMEAGKHTNPSLDTLCKLASALDVTIDDLVECNGNEG